jgi:uncharacterized membrane protein YbhN (UPF0104 family)
MKRFFHIVGTLLIVLIFSWAMYQLAVELRKYTFQEILGHIRNTPRWGLWTAIGLTMVSYVVLVAYDLLAITFVKEKLALWKIALASFIGYAFSYNFGATLTGGPLRYRLYAGWKLPMVKIVELLVILGLTFWFGLFFLAGILFLIHPLQLPPDLQALFEKHGIHVLAGNFRLLGIVLLTIALSYLGLSALFKGRVKIWRWEIPVPPFRLTVYQYAIATVDFLIAAGVLYALLPPMPGVDMISVTGVYILAYVAEVLSHVPGGWGVFDVVILKLLPGDSGPIIAAVILFRVIYRLIPVLIAAVFLLANELALRRDALAQLGRMLGQSGAEGNDSDPDPKDQP